MYPFSPSAQDSFSAGERFRIGSSLVAPVALLWIASRHGWVPIPPKFVLIALPCALLIGLFFPVPFSPWHQLVFAAQKWIGHRILLLLLGLAFVLTILPIGLWLRLRGRSFLGNEGRPSYWVTSQPPGSLRNQF